MSQLAQDDILKASDSSISFLAVTNHFFTLYPHIHTIVDNFVTKLNLEITTKAATHSTLWISAFNCKVRLRYLILFLFL